MKSLIHLSALAVAGLSLTTVAKPGSGDEGSCSISRPSTAWSAEKDIVETAVSAGKFKTLATTLQAAGLVEALQGEGPFTVFAPTDEAFARLPEKKLEALLKPESRGTLQTILKHHVVPGRIPAADVVELKSARALNGQRLAIRAGENGVRVAGSKVVQTDILCSNGIIHVVDEVMMPATTDVVATAVESGRFETLAAALGAGGLVEALQGEGPFTVFAPTDDAFAALPEGTVASLLEPENRAKLVSILQHHVVPGRIYSDQLANGRVRTLQGSSLEIESKEKRVLVGGARVTAADLEATNGVIHVIDRVLIPGFESCPRYHFQERTAARTGRGPLSLARARGLGRRCVADPDAHLRRGAARLAPDDGRRRRPCSRPMVPRRFPARSPILARPTRPTPGATERNLLPAPSLRRP